MTLDELIEILTEYRDDIGGHAEVRTMTQRNYPFENSIYGICSQQEMYEQGDDDDDADGEADDVIYIVEGQQLGYGSGAAWNAARRY